MSRSLSNHPDLQEEPAWRLAASDFVYQRLRDEVLRLRRRKDPALLPFIEEVARFAWLSHPGRLSDGALENPLLEIGRGIGRGAGDVPPPEKVERPDSPPSLTRTLHVASEVYVTGGHSRVLAKWIQRDLISSPAIVLTRQAGDIPDFFRTIAGLRGAPITTLNPMEGIVERAQQLRALSQGFDRVILHHHPDDAVPTLAYATPGGCPVVLFNHAHFWFSLGGGVADMIVNTSPYFRRLTEQHRFPQATDLLLGPSGLVPLRWTDIDKRKAKESLGLSPDRPVVMTIGNEVYFTPSKDVSFFGTLSKILALRTDLQVLVVGVRENSELVPSSIRDTGRVRLVGPVADPRPFYEAADLCLESAPMPSLGGLIEAVAYGQAFPVLAFAESESPRHINPATFAGISERQPSEDDYIRDVCALLDVRESAFERAGVLRRVLIAEDERFGDQFAGLYERIDRLEHAPRELPTTACCAAPDNLELAAPTDPAMLGHAINHLPIRTAMATHRRAVAEGFEEPRTAAYQAARKVVRSVFRRLPIGMQRRLKRSGPANG